MTTITDLIDKYLTDSDGRLLHAIGPSKPTTEQYDASCEDVSSWACEIANDVVAGRTANPTIISFYREAKASHDRLKAVYFHDYVYGSWWAGALIPAPGVSHLSSNVAA